MRLNTAVHAQKGTLLGLNIQSSAASAAFPAPGEAGWERGCVDEIGCGPGKPYTNRVDAEGRKFMSYVRIPYYFDIAYDGGVDEGVQVA